ncbi:MAG TPA: hypothetical protein VKG78_07140 [Opitutaceae bacterium]|nr:hypothetical protein [Opitutaceae bacterium]
MRLRGIGIFLLVCLLLAPLAWIVLNGPKVAYAELLGGIVAMGCLFLRRQPLAWVRAAPALMCGLVYAVCAFVEREPRDLFPYQAAVLLLFYGFPTGLCLRRLSQDGHDRAVAWALVCFSIAMSAVAAVILQEAGAARIVSEAGVGAEMSRSNATNEMSAVYYLRYFSITNIIIGIIPFTVFGLSMFPILLTARALTIRLGALCAIALAAYVNIQVATRTTLAACALSSVIIIPFVIRAVPFRRRLLFGVTFFAMIVAGIVYGTRNKDIFHFLANRFADISEDSRLTIWRESLRILANTPDGGGIRRLTSHVWAHNVLLDVGLANGWIALGAVLALFCVGLFFAWRSTREPGFSESSANMIALGWLLAGMLSLMVLPPLLPLLATVYIALASFAPYRSTSAPGKP